MPASPAGRACAWPSRSAPPISPPGCRMPYLGRSPVIALTGRKEPSFQHRNAYQEIAHAPLFSAVTKFSTPVNSTAELPRLLRHAWRAALADTPRPTHLDFCGLQGDVIELGQTAEPTVIDPERAANPGASAGRRRTRHRARRRGPDRGPPRRDRRRRRRRGLAAAARNARTGRGAGGAGRDLARRPRPHPDTPSVCRSACPAAIPHRRPTASSTAPIWCCYVGCDTGDQVTLNWTVPPLATRRSCRSMPIRSRIGRSYPNTIGVVGDPKATLSPPRSDDRGDARAGARSRRFAEEAARIVADWRATMAPLVNDDRAPIRVERLCAEITQALPADGILVADTGYSGIWTGTMIDFNGAGQTYLRAAGSLGWSFPASLGAKCAAPGPRGAVLHRRRRLLLSPRRAGIGAALPASPLSSSSTTIRALARI